MGFVILVTVCGERETPRESNGKSKATKMLHGQTERRLKSNYRFLNTDRRNHTASHHTRVSLLLLRQDFDM